MIESDIKNAINTITTHGPGGKCTLKQLMTRLGVEKQPNAEFWTMYERMRNEGKIKEIDGLVYLNESI